MPINSKQKGKGGELEVAKLFAQYGIKMRRTAQVKGTPQSADVEADPEGEPLHEDINSIIHIEVKRVQAFNLYAAMDQATDDLGGLQEPVVFHRKNGRNWVVVIDARFFIRLFRLYLASMIAKRIRKNK